MLNSVFVKPGATICAAGNPVWWPHVATPASMAVNVALGDSAWRCLAHAMSRDLAGGGV